MAYEYDGRWGTRNHASKASTAYAAGELVANDDTNNVPATSTTKNIIGICMKDKASTDSATTRLPIRMPKDKGAGFVMAVTGTFTTADEGSYFDLSNSTTVNTAGTTYKVVRCQKFLTSTLGVFSINDPIS